jgi:O-methyltransferase involved in polyketide biosynthesis
MMPTKAACLTERRTHVDERPAPSGVDTSIPNVARMYDYALGGKDNFAADRAAAEHLFAAVPEVGRVPMRLNRAFLGRAVRFFAESGIRQLLDIGAGLPTQGNVHEIAQATAPNARVVYVDYDPVVVTHGRALLATSDTVTVVPGDLRRPDEIVNNPEVRALIDFDQPVAVLLVAILHFIADTEDPIGIVTRIRDHLPSGSYVAISHVSVESYASAIEKGRQIYRGATAGVSPRTRAEIMRLFEGFELVDPGLVWLPQWRADSPDVIEHPELSLALAGVGRR